MAGIGDSWGTREELLHPRDNKGRFRSKWKLSERAFQAVIGALGPFSPRTFQSDAQATQYAVNLGHSKPGRFQSGRGNVRLIQDWHNANNDLLDGNPDEPSTKKFVEMMDQSMMDLPEDTIVGMVVGPDAFGLTPDRIGEIENMKNTVIANRGYTAANVGQPLAGGAGQVTMSVATPKGTKMAFPATSQSDNSAIYDRDQEFTITKVKPDGRGGMYVWAVATPKTPEENPEPVGGKAGPGNSGDREADIKSIEDVRMKRDMGEQGASQLPGGQAAGGLPEDDQGRIKANAPGGDAAAGDPATERAKRRAAILGRPASGQQEESAQAPAAPPAGAPTAPEANVPEAVTPAPSGVDVPSGATSTATGEAQASFRDKINDANLESPSKAARKDFNDAIAGVESGKRNPADIVRDLDSDVADLKRQQGQEGSDREQLGQDADKLTKLADVIAEHFQTPGNENRDKQVQSAEKPATKAPSDAPARGPKKQVSAGDRSAFEEKMDARLATRAPVAKKADPAARKEPSPVEIRAEKQKALLNDTGARPTKKKVDPKKIGVAPPAGNQLDRDLEDDRLNAEQRAEWSNELGPEPAILKKQAGNVLLDEVADLLRNGRITKPKAAARLRDQAREDDDAGADYLRRAADMIEADTSKAKKRVPLKPKRGVVPDEAEAALAGRTERNILTGLNQLDVGNLRGLADRWGVETRGDDKKLKTKAVLSKELAAHWKATPSLQQKAPDAAPVDELDELLLPALKARAKADGITVNSKMRKAEILAALKAKRDGSGEAEAVPEAVAETPAAVKKVAKKAAKKLPPGGMTPEEFAEASPRILAGEDVDAVGRDILGRRGAAAELDLPIEGTPGIADAASVKARLQDIGDNGDHQDAVDYMDSLKLGAKDLRLLADELGVATTSKQNKTQVRDTIINVHATGRQNTRAVRRALEAPRTPEAKDLAAVADAPEVPKPIAKAAAKAAKTADKAADTADEVSELYHPDVETADLKTMDDLSTEDRIAVSMLNMNNGRNRTKILLAMSKEHPEEAKRVLKAEQIMAEADAAEHGPLTPEDRITLTYLKLAENQPGLREKILLENPERARILNAEKLLAAEEAGEAPSVPTEPTKKAAGKVTPKVMDEVVQEAKEKVATTKGPKDASPWDRVAALVMRRIGEIDPEMKKTVLAEMSDDERNTLTEVEHRVELQRTRVKKGGGDLDQILADRGIDGPPDSSPSGVAFDRAREAVAKGFPDQAVKELRRDQMDAKQEKDLARRSAVDPALSPRAREASVQRSQRAAEREAMAGDAADAIEASPEVDTKPGKVTKAAVQDVVVTLPEDEKASWDAATADDLKKAAAIGGITLPDGATTKDEVLQEVVREIARRKLAGEELPNFKEPEAPRAPEPTLPKASANIKGDTVEGFTYREALRRLESGESTPAEAADDMKQMAKVHRRNVDTVRGNSLISPEARAAGVTRELSLARQYDEAAAEVRARKRVPKPAVVAEVLDQASDKATGKGPNDFVADALARATSTDGGEAALAGLTAPKLRELAKHMNIAVGSKDSKQKVKDTIIFQAVQRRLNSDAVSRPMPARGDGESIADWTARGQTPASVSEVLARGRGSIAPEATSTTSPMSAFANPALAEASRNAPSPRPVPAKKVAKKAAAAAAEDATVRGLQRMAEGGFREETPAPTPAKKVAKKAAPSIETQVETRMEVAKAVKKAAPAAAPSAVGNVTRESLIESGPGGLKNMEDELGITRPSLDRGERADAILAKMAENAAPTPAKKVAKKAAPATSGGQIQAGNFTDEAPIPNKWGTPGGEVNYHASGAIGRLVGDLGQDRQLNVDGSSLENTLGRIATRGHANQQRMIDELRDLAERLPAGPQREVMDAVQEIDTPKREMPKVPENVPDPLKSLVKRLTNIPLARSTGQRGEGDRKPELDQAVEIAEQFAAGELSASRFLRALEQMMAARHESIEGGTELRNAIRDAIEPIRARYNNPKTRHELVDLINANRERNQK